MGLARAPRRRRPAAALRSGVSLSLLCGSVAACRDAAPPAPSARVVVQDSAGVLLTTVEGALSDAAGSTRDTDRLFRVGSRSGEELYVVTGARILPGDRAIIANAGSQELLVIDDDGRITSRIGRSGEGPGEFQWVTSVHLENGQFITYDDRLARISSFDTSGTFLTSRQLKRIDRVRDLLPLTASMDGPTLGIWGDNRRFGEPGTTRSDSTPLFQITPGQEDMDTLSLWPDKTWHFGAVGLGTSRAQVALSPTLGSSGGGHRIVLADTHRPTVHVLDTDGDLLMQLRWSEPERPVTEEDFEAWKVRRSAEFGADMPDDLRERLLDVPYHDVHPIIHGVAVEREGGFWVAAGSDPDTADLQWIHVDASGKVGGRVMLPRKARILDAVPGRLLLLERTRLDEEVVVLLRVDPA